jgi:hypothetical protein
MLRYPAAHVESYFISAVFAAIFLLAYVALMSLGGIRTAVVSKSE